MTPTTFFWIAAGVLLGVGFVGFAGRFGRRRDLVVARGLVVAALVYCGFALVAARPGWLGLEIVGVALYGTFAVLGVRRSAVWLAVGWAGHVGWDVGLHAHGVGAVVAPQWYVAACIGFDLAVATGLLGSRPLRGSDTKAAVRQGH